jgi:hypothetical protein
MKKKPPNSQANDAANGLGVTACRAREARRAFPGRVHVIPMLLVICLLGSCASAPSSNPGEGTLLVVPILIIDARNSALEVAEYSYQINLENIETGKRHSFIFRPEVQTDYQFVTGYPPGKYLIKDYIPMGLKNAKREPLYSNQYLILEEGKLNLFPFKIIFIKEDSKNPAYAGSVWISFSELDEKQGKRMVKFLNGKNRLKGWRQ